MTRLAIGFYHDPPIFLGEVPFDTQTRRVSFDRFAVEAIRLELAEGLVVNASVQGQFGFDFSAVTRSGIGAAPTNHDDFESWAESVVARTMVMNAFLAFFYSRLISAEQRIMERMVISPNLTIPMERLGGPLEGGTSNAHVSHLMSSGLPGTYMIGIHPDGDRRLVGRVHAPPIRLETVRSAASDLSDVLDKFGEQGVALIDIFLRASRAFQDHNQSLSLVNYWTVAEQLINRLWKQFQSDNASRDDVMFIDTKRRKRLNDSRTFSAAVVCEILSFQGYIDNDLYDDIVAVRRARNNWMHSMQKVRSNDSYIANRVCERLLEQAMGVTIYGASQRFLHG